MEGTIKVDPQQLISASSEFSTNGNQVQTLMNEMVNKMNNLGTTNTGDAISSFIAKANGLQNDIAKLNAMIQEHAKDLQEMAQVYSSAESAAQSEADALQTSVIN